MEELQHKQQKNYITNLVFHSKTKHIGVQYHFVRKFEEGRVDMQKIHTKDKLVGVMIKSINTSKILLCQSSCGLSEM
ncbi:hypothetical protein CR513_61987, partial [Mucuna pruriens]